MNEQSLDMPRVDRDINGVRYRCNRLLLGDWIELETLIIRVLGVQVLDLDENNIASAAPVALKRASKNDHEQVFELLGRALMVQREDGKWAQLTRATCASSRVRSACSSRCSSRIFSKGSANS